MIKFSNCVKKSSFLVHRMSYNLIRQFLNVAFNEIFCKLVLLLFYGTTAEYIASGSWWLLWPKCWLETEFNCRLRLRFSLMIQLNHSKCVEQPFFQKKNSFFDNQTTNSQESKQLKFWNYQRRSNSKTWKFVLVF